MIVRISKPILASILLLGVPLAGCLGDGDVAAPDALVTTPAPDATTTDASGHDRTERPADPLPLPTTSAPVATAAPAPTPTIDSDAPLIPTESIGVQAGSVAATIEWIVRDASLVKSYVEYGATTQYGSKSALVPGTGAVQVDLSGLVADKTYHYRICSTDEYSHAVCTPSRTFWTANNADLKAPRVLNHSLVPTTDHADVVWNIEEDAAYVETNLVWGVDPEAMSRSPMQYGKGEHKFTITGLDPETKYFWRIFVMDAASNPGGIPTATFTTLAVPDTQSPTVSNIHLVTASTSTARLNWTLTDDKPGPKSRLEYHMQGAPEPFGSRTEYNPCLAECSILLGNLQPGKTYVYRIRAFDNAIPPHETLTANMTFDTMPLLPPQVYEETVKPQKIFPTALYISFQFSGPDGTTAHIEYGENGTALDDQTPPVSVTPGVRTGATLILIQIVKEKFYDYVVVLTAPDGTVVRSAVHQSWSAYDMDYHILGNLGENSYSPAQKTVKAGRPLAFKVTNDDTGIHGFYIYGQPTNYRPAGGETKIIEPHIQLEVGTYSIICNVPGHEGMRATIFVN